MIYWILEETLGYSYGIVTLEKEIPTGGRMVKDQAEQLAEVKKLEVNLEKELNDFFITGPDKLEKELNKEDKDKDKDKTPPGQEDKDLNQEDRRNNNGR